MSENRTPEARREAFEVFVAMIIGGAFFLLGLQYLGVIDFFVLFGSIPEME